jgi:eukaryotic-like serine/threonine-protein kinase
MQNLAGLKYGPYIVSNLLGYGGFAAVYRVRMESTPGTFVMKVLAHEYSRDPKIVAMFAMEAQIISQLKHPNIVEALLTDTLYGRPYLLFRDEAGETLHSLLEAELCHPKKYFLQILNDIASGIDYLHAQGFVHRDIKPRNILVPDHGGAKLLDFGLAARITTLASVLNPTAGTPGYLAPEVLSRGQISKSSDIFSFGMTIQTVLSRFPPDIFQQAYDRIVSRAISPDVNTRPATATSIMHTLLAKDG